METNYCKVRISTHDLTGTYVVHVEMTGIFRIIGRKFSSGLYKVLCGEKDTKGVIK